ncbi:hypothetical protein [Achromobacter veterisilvae]|uniref:hypothetical protein n=1 Tax=Achromobacter veterisilvae TaxID=2069367 RepID=UPI00100E9488|nr:hypothetical protein [Achromobacter veterisilvae]
MQVITGALQSRPIPSAAGAIAAASGAYVLQSRGGASGGTILATDPGTTNLDLVTFDTSRVARTSTETRGSNAAYHPRIHA